MQTGMCPRWTNDSPTTFRAGSSACGPGLLHWDCPPQASPLRPVAAEGGLDSSTASFEPRLPVPLLVERVMHVDRGVVIGMSFIVAHRTSEQLATLLCDAVGHLVGGVFIHVAHMPPELLIAPLACHRLA